MRKESLRFYVVVSLAAMLLVAAALVGCGNNGKTTEDKNAPVATEQKADTKVADKDKADSKLTVYTSFYPMYDFTKKIVGDKAEVVNLVPAGSEPHDWEPSTQDMAKLAKAKVLVINGAGMEHWAHDVIDASKNSDLKVITASDGVDLIKNEGHDHDHDHDADDAHEHEEDHDHDKDAAEHDEHDHEGEEHEHHHGAYDPHVWLSVRDAKIELKNIADGLAEVDPANADFYKANYEKYAKDFDELDKEYTEKLAKVPNKELVVSHAAFGYLCRDYGLTQLGIAGINADQEPNPTRMAEIVDFVKEHHVKKIFTEELVSPKVAESIAKETGAKTEVLNPLEGLSDEELKNGEDYISVMKKNLDKMVEALS